MFCLGLNKGYLQFGLSAFTMHDQWIPPPVPAKAIPGLIEGPAFMGWHPGRPLTHKVGKKTFFDGNKAVQQGHDVGYLIPHFAAPPNVMMAINMLVSKHKVMFPVNSVLIEGKPLGTYVVVILGGLICSNPVSLPTGVLYYLSGTVRSSMTILDILLGLTFIAVDVLIDAVWSLIVKGDHWGKFGPGKAMPPFYKAMLEKIFSKKMIADEVKKVADFSGRQLTSLIIRNTVAKLADHVSKSWVISPLVSGTIFQLSQPAWGVPRTSLPAVSIGRAGFNLQFFPKFKLGGNVFN